MVETASSRKKMASAPDTSASLPTAVSKESARKLRSHLAETLPFDFMIKCPAEVHRPATTFSEWPVPLSFQPPNNSDHPEPSGVSKQAGDQAEETTSPHADSSSAETSDGFLAVPELKAASTEIVSFDVHACVLAKFDMFKAIINTPMKEHYEHTIFIPDFPSSVVDKFIDYVYDEWVNDVDAETAVDLIKLADCYLIPDLKELCGVILSDEAARKPVDMCAFAHTYGVKTLRLECERILPSHVASLPDEEIEKLLKKTSQEWSGMHTLGIRCQKELLDRLSCDKALHLFKLAYETSSSDLFEGVLQFVISEWGEMLSSNPVDAKYLMEWNVSRARLVGPGVFNITGGEVKKPKEPCEGHWIRMNGRENIPTRALRCGTTGEGTTVYVGRMRHQGFTIPGYIVDNALHVCYAGEEVEEDDDYEVLVPLPGGGNYAWVRSSQNNIPPAAVYGGTQENGERLFIGRHRLDSGDTLAGKVHVSHSCLYIGAEGREIGFSNYDILVRK